MSNLSTTPEYDVETSQDTPPEKPFIPSWLDGYSEKIAIEILKAIDRDLPEE